MRDRLDIDHVKRDRGALIAVLEAADATITGDKVRCPFHDDRTASGSIHEGTNGDGVWLYTCHGCSWNGDKASGDVLAVVQHAKRLTFTEACQHLSIGEAGNNGSSVPRGSDDRSDAQGIKHARQDADAAHKRLMADADTLDHLRRTRGIDAGTAARFRIGIVSYRERRFWTLPIHRDGDFYACKYHRADLHDQKSRWVPSGVKSHQLWPVSLVGPGPVWVCSGELKALAVIGVGRPAIGITSGEGSAKKPTSLPAALIDLLRGRAAALPPDDDTTGAAWGDHVAPQLREAGIDARIVDVGLDRDAGLKDIGDWITRRLVEDDRDAESVAATLDDKYARSDPWHGVMIGDIWSSGSMWKPVTHISTGFTELDDVLGGGLRTGGVHQLVAKANRGKTQLGVAIAINAARAGTPTGIFSLEFDKSDVAKLVAAQLGGIPRRCLDAGKITGDHAQRLRDVQDQHSKLPLAVLDEDRWPHGLDRGSFAQAVAEGVERFKWKLVILDYLGLLLAPESDGTEFRSDILNSTAMKRIARKHDIALVLIAALRKSASSNRSKDEEITLDDVAGAGRLTYDAQNVLLVSARRGDDDCGIVHVRPLKLKFAPVIEGADVQLRWRPATGLIENPDEQTGARGS